jgi:hypothetical protein
MKRLIALIGSVRSSAGRELHVLPFARGISMGALVGAAIAGSTIWRLRRDRDRLDAPRAPKP